MSFRQIKTICDVVDWGLCIGCGACVYFCEKKRVALRNFESVGLRPTFGEGFCDDCTECLEICPGYRVDAGIYRESTDPQNRLTPSENLVGPTQGVWEGFAADDAIHFRGSSGGIISALAAYCIEREKMRFVLHTGLDPAAPWANQTVKSESRTEILNNAGSRYAPSSPCDRLAEIEYGDGKCVFIGKPCDVAAVSALRRRRPRLDKNLGLVLTFFCAGTPSNKGTLDLIAGMRVTRDSVKMVRFRGHGWPGDFHVVYGNERQHRSLSYKESWGAIQKYRPLRCQLCPDGLGELGDVSCGDAWHLYREGETNGNGVSVVLARSARGQEYVLRAARAGYLSIVPSSERDVIRGQGLVRRRTEVYGRLVAMKLLGIPTPKYGGFPIADLWKKKTTLKKVRTILGTMKRLISRGHWHKNEMPSIDATEAPK